MKRSALYLLLLFLSVLPGRVSALTVQRLHLPDLARQADFVARGRVVGSTVRETPRLIVTVYSFKVERCYRMTTTSCPATVPVVLLGGRVGDKILEVPGVPDLRTLQDEAILFLSQGTPTGVSQGIFTVRDGQVHGPLLREINSDGMALSQFEQELMSLLKSVLHGRCDSTLCQSNQP